VAVKATVLPAQDGLAETAIETLTGNDVLTVIDILLEVAGLPDLQVKFDVSTQVIKSPWMGIYEYITLVAPEMFDPFFFH
jgi:hypothetical protein